MYQRLLTLTVFALTLAALTYFDVWGRVFDDVSLVSVNQEELDTVSYIEENLDRVTFGNRYSLLHENLVRDCAVYEAAFSELRIAFGTISPLKLSLYTIPNRKRYFYGASEDREQSADLSPFPLDLCRFPEVYGFEVVDTFEPDRKGVVFSDIDYRANETVAHFEVKFFYGCGPCNVTVLRNNNVWGQAAVQPRVVLD